MSKQRRFILMASIVGVIAVFLPWVVIEVGKMDKYINGFHGYGTIVLIAFVIAAMICFSGDRHKTPGTTIWFIVVTGTVALVFIIISLLNNHPSSSLNTKTGFGVWVSLFAAVAVIASALFLKGSTTNFKTGLDGFRRSISIPIINATDVKANPGISKKTELEKLARLRANGDISQQEFDELKSQLL